MTRQITFHFKRSSLESSRVTLSCLPSQLQAAAAVQVGSHASLFITSLPLTSLHRAKPIFPRMGLVKEGKAG